MAPPFSGTVTLRLCHEYDCFASKKTLFSGLYRHFHTVTPSKCNSLRKFTIKAFSSKTYHLYEHFTKFINSFFPHSFLDCVATYLSPFRTLPLQLYMLHPLHQESLQLAIGPVWHQYRDRYSETSPSEAFLHT